MTEERVMYEVVFVKFRLILFGSLEKKVTTKFLTQQKI